MIEVADLYEDLTHAFNLRLPRTEADETTDLYKILLIYVRHQQDFENDLEIIEEWRAIDNAEGTTLDLLGKSVGQYRIDDDDEFFRFQIKAAYAVAHCNGTCDDLLNLISSVLQVPQNLIRLEEGYTTGGDARAIKISGIPFVYAQDSRRIGLLTNLISKGVALGIHLAGVYFSEESGAEIEIGMAMQVLESQTITQK